MHRLYVLLLLLTCWIVPSYAKSENVQYFDGSEGCGIIYDITAHRKVFTLGAAHCGKRAAPDSTFKIPLSLIAFDMGLITQQTRFAWDGQQRLLPVWNREQTPQTWLKYSAVWVSQLLAPKIGLNKLQNYLREFDYGNQDLSGTPGKHDGLTQAWLSNSLQISPNEQLHFLQRLLTRQLPVSETAVAATLDNLFLGELNDGWKLYGKTGSGYDVNHRTEGWFAGYLMHDKQRYIVITHFTKKSPGYDAMTGGGGIARAIALRMVRDKLGVY